MNKLAETELSTKLAELARKAQRIVQAEQLTPPTYGSSQENTISQR